MNNKKKDNIAWAAVGAALIAALCAVAARGETAVGGGTPTLPTADGAAVSSKPPYLPTARAAFVGSRVVFTVTVTQEVHHIFGHVEIRLADGTVRQGWRCLGAPGRTDSFDLAKVPAETVHVKFHGLAYPSADETVAGVPFIVAARRTTPQSRWRFAKTHWFERVPRGGAVIVK